MKFKKYLPLLAACISFLFCLIVIREKFESSFEERFESEENESPQLRAEMAEKRAEYFFRLTRDPSTNSIPVDIREKELSFAKGIPSKEMMLGKSSSAASITWQEVGPNDVGGRTRAIAVDVTNSNNIIVGGVSGGIWKSTDGGTTWRMKTSSSEVLSVTSIAQDPRPGFTNIWYYTAGEFSGNSAADRGYTAYYYGAGFYKSTDNGETWVKSQATNPISWSTVFSYTSRIVVNPSTGSVFVASHAGEILRSTDGGANWTNSIGKLNSHYYTEVAVNSNGLLVASLSTAHPTGSSYDDIPTNGIFKSTDNGGTWTSITPASFPAAYSRSSIAFAPSNPNSFYIITTTGSTNITTNREDVYLFKINASTGAYTNLTANLPYFASTRKNDYIVTQGSYNLAIAVHPSDENLVLIGGTSLFRSFDGFTTRPSSKLLSWIGGYNEASFFYPNLHPDVHAIVFDKNIPNKVWVGSDGGLSVTGDITNQSYSSVFPWISANNSYNVTQFYTVALKDVSGDVRIMGGTQDNGTPFFRTSDPSKLSDDVSSGDGSYCAFMPSWAYSSSQNGTVNRLFYANGSGDPQFNGAISPDTSLAKGQLFINPFVVDPSDENYMYYLAGRKLWRNNNITNSSVTYVKANWTSIDLGLQTSDIISTIAVSKTNPSNVVYLGVYNSSYQPKILKMVNSKTATTAVDISPVYPGTLSYQVPTGTYVHCIAVNPDNGNEILAVMSNYKVRSLWYSTNGGTSWTDVTGTMRDGTTAGNGPSVRTAAILPIDATNKVFLIGTSTGVYSASALSANTTWAQEASSLIGNVVVEHLAIRKSDGTIAVGTHGRGAFIGKASGGVGITADNSVTPKEYILYHNYPNPFNPTTKIKYSLPENAKIAIRVYDQLGREIKTLFNGVQNAGSHEVEWRGDNNEGGKVASGIYIYALSTNKTLLTRKMVLLK